MRKYSIMHSYGLSRRHYIWLLLWQDFKCAICKREVTLLIDHKHDGKNRARGLLCKKCNDGLGKFGDSRKLLYRAMTYLYLHEQENILDFLLRRKMEYSQKQNKLVA